MYTVEVLIQLKRVCLQLDRSENWNEIPTEQMVAVIRCSVFLLCVCVVRRLWQSKYFAGEVFFLMLIGMFCELHTGSWASNWYIFL